MCLGIPGEAVSRCERDGLPFGDVRFGGVVRGVCMVCYPDVAPGEFVLVHVGMAIARIDRDEAARAWRVLEELGQTAEVGAPALDPPLVRDTPDPRPQPESEAEP